MSFNVQQAIAVAEWKLAVWRCAVDFFAAEGHAITASAPRLCIASECERKRKRGAAVALVLEFEAVGDSTFAWLNHAQWDDLLKKLSAHMAAKFPRVVGSNVIIDSRDIAVFPTDEHPAPTCDDDECSCCGGKFVDTERFSKVLLYVGE